MNCCESINVCASSFRLYCLLQEQAVEFFIVVRWYVLQTNQLWICVVFQSVSTCLLKKGRQNFRELLRNSNLPVPQLREALLVLIQLNLVACHRVAHEGFGHELRTEYVYEAQIERMLQILRLEIVYVRCT